ncbi:MAG: hypothetical protein ABI190_00210, partial [Casimicrobiaceae bacterium]
AMVIAMEIARSFMTVTFETLQQVFPAGLAWIAGSPAPPRVAGFIPHSQSSANAGGERGRSRSDRICGFQNFCR